ncbi:MAG: ABC transporter, permease protein 1 (cluster 1, maltose/g3p/polyamine/iron) [uncultured Blastococcus sp.]|uniref:ABC transporter, permease protein 1 (Cluster 1, maltose/g3p/polyamine/iron) n=1 Tax=uncultured Blastococcus sp. TaxID=217144 RepID=A0A6J4HKD9_9ACTN|nr:MAG: ABC transporter, permease protein 1 (cluster 1, maltose/g3p/polyamine/iron) [uncultured Blastococcus sp.]
MITANPAPEAGQKPDPGLLPGRARPARRRRRQWLPYLLLLPVLLAELLIHIIPMLVGVGMSFLQLTQFYIRNWTEAPSAGLNNYRFALQFDQASGKALLHSFWTTVVFTVIVLALSWGLAMMAAVWTQRAFRGRGLVRTAFLVPYALPVFASVITWSFMLQRDNGVVNHVLVEQLGLLDDRPFWLIGDNSFIALVVVEVWRLWPFAFLALTAGMSAIPSEQYEAAALDGAGVFRQIRWVTLPNLRSVNQVLLLVLFLWTFNEFTVPYTFFGKSAPEQANLISMHIYQNSFVTWNFGAGSAMSVLLLLFLLLVTTAYLFLTRRRRDA